MTVALPIPGSPLRVVVADDHEMARAGLRALLGGLPSLQVIAEARNGAEAIDLATRLQPDLLLLDLRMPDIDGLQVIRHLRRRPPMPCVVVVTVHDNIQYLREARDAGAHGYVLKDVGRSELLAAIEIAVRDWWCGAAGTGSRHPAIFPPEQRLTLRETQVLALVAQGLTNRQIGDRLGIASGTAKLHVEHILAKLGVGDRTQAAVRAAALGLAPMPSR